MRRLWTITALILAMVSGPGAFAAERICYYINDHSGRDVVTFSSDAAIELIEGRTNRITGKVCFDDDYAFKDPDIEFVVDLPSLKTGIDLRDQHMRDNFLHTDRYPKALYVVDSVRLSDTPPFEAGQEVAVVSTGRFTVHGKTVTKTIPLKVTVLPESKLTHRRFSSGNLIRIRGDFPVVLEEHGIPRPQALFMKLADTMTVSLDAMGTDDPTALE